MKYLEKTWIRVIISLLAGSMVAEAIHISTGDPNRPRTSNLPLLFYALIIYGILTFVVKKRNKTML